MYSFPRRMWHRHNQSCGVGHRARAPRGALGLVTPGHITLTASRHLVTRCSLHYTCHHHLPESESRILRPSSRLQLTLGGG